MTVGIVVIGRNEGDRLVACLQSLPLNRIPIVYVDSGSSDGSLERASQLGAEVVSLDLSTPFSAARARNTGCERIVNKNPSIKYIQFIDGDCMLFEGWLGVAHAALENNSELAAVFGCVVEINAEKTIYNTLCSLEWETSFGLVQASGAFGGISMLRLSAFLNVKGFNPDVIAGEDAELAARLLLAHHQIEKLDSPMVHHDANITRFGQWWQRSVRSGHAIGQRAHLHGSSVLKDCIRERTSVIVWGMLIPLVAVCTFFISTWLMVGVVSLYGVLSLKIWRHRRRRGNSARDAGIYAVFTVLGKFAETIGLIRFWKNRFFMHYDIIEYK
jgi:glycosyltransferase involved in cell wall biosynthesis